MFRKITISLISVTQITATYPDFSKEEITQKVQEIAKKDKKKADLLKKNGKSEGRL